MIEEYEERKQAFELEQRKWRDYFLNNDNKGLDFLNDMETALKTNYIDRQDADLCLMGLAARLRELNEIVSKLHDRSKQGEMDKWRAKK
jgi:chlorite dismutase